jgi:hypothetical protein
MQLPPQPTPPPPEPPPPTPTIPPSPTPNARLVVELTEQSGEDFSLNPGGTRVAFRASAISGGLFVTRIYLADLVTGMVQPLATEGLPPMDHLGLAWHPDGQHVAIGLTAAEGGPGAPAIVPLNGEPGAILSRLPSGFDVPRSYSPDGIWLAVTHFSGDSPANSGDATLVLQASTGNRVAVAAGGAYANADAILGWVPAPPPPPPPPSPTP